MKIVFIVDFGLHIGSGHLSRCQVLAKSLVRSGAEVEIIVNPNSLVAVEKKNADWIVLDSYKIGLDWEVAFRTAGFKVMTIDDNPKRPIQADLLLDPNISKEGSQRWDGFVSSWTRVLAGCEYLLLRDEFLSTCNIFEWSSVPTGLIRVLISMGGADEAGVAVQIMQAIALHPYRHRLQVVVVAGSLNPNHNKLQQLSTNLKNSIFVHSTEHMASLIRTCNICFGAGGVSQWERAYMGLPSLVVTLAQNQHHAVQYFNEIGAIKSLGYYHYLTSDKINKALTWAIENPDQLQQMAIKAKIAVGEPIFIKNPMRVFYSI
jgi:UDP-2,4-diacetamido-2,4,6-trideoxy-beta-L-altropyranose hydrolase